MTEQQHRLGVGLAHGLPGKVEVDLQVIAKVCRWMDPHFAAQPGEFMRDGLCNAVHGGFVVAGGFDFYEVANGQDDLIAALVEIGKTTVRFDAGMRGRFSGERFHVRSSSGLLFLPRQSPFLSSLFTNPVSCYPNLVADSHTNDPVPLRTHNRAALKCGQGRWAEFPWRG